MLKTSYEILHSMKIFGGIFSSRLILDMLASELNEAQIIFFMLSKTEFRVHIVYITCIEDFNTYTKN